MTLTGLWTPRANQIARGVEIVTGVIVVLICLVLLARADAPIGVRVAQADSETPLYATNPIDGSPQPVLTDGHGRIQIAGFLPTNITTNTVAQIKSRDGMLRCLTVNQPGRDSVARLLDWRPSLDTLRPPIVIATIDTSVRGTWCYDAMFTAGLAVETVGQTPADVTVGYR